MPTKKALLITAFILLTTTCTFAIEPSMYFGTLTGHTIGLNNIALMHYEANLLPIMYNQITPGFNIGNTIINNQLILASLNANALRLNLLTGGINHIGFNSGNLNYTNIVDLSYYTGNATVFTSHHVSTQSQSVQE